MSTKDTKDKLKRINKRIDRERKKYDLIIENLNKGFDITTGEEYHDKETIERKKNEARNNYYNFLVKAQNRIVEIETGIDEDNKMDEQEEQKETSRKHIKRRMSGKIATFTATLLITIVSGIGINNYISHENEVSRKISSYSQDLDEVIDNSTYSRIGNLVYQNGVVVETLDKDLVTDKEYTYVDYSNIARYIEQSDNPDLAVFALYKKYGRENHNPTYHRIISQTFKTLEFDGSNMGSMDNFSEYINVNGYNSYDEYYKATRKELFSDEDNDLNNIKVNIKKMTK